MNAFFPRALATESQGQFAFPQEGQEWIQCFPKAACTACHMGMEAETCLCSPSRQENGPIAWVVSC